MSRGQQSVATDTADAPAEIEPGDHVSYSV